MEFNKMFLLKNLMECTQAAIEVFSDESDDEVVLGLLDLCQKAADLPEKEKRKRQWIKPWRVERDEDGSFVFLTKKLLHTDKPSYSNYLRITSTQFDFLLNLIKPDIERTNTQLRDAIPPEEKLATTLRFLASGESYKSLNYQTKLSTSFICQMIPEVCTALYMRLKEQYVKMPSNPAEWEGIAKEFALKWQFPNCLGALDGKHITFRPPHNSGAYYHNYKGTDSIILLALVDANCKFIFADIGCNGRSNDAGVLLQSPLRNILDEEKGLPSNAIVGRGRNLPYVIVSDDAFPLQRHILKPYPYHTKSNAKKILNMRLSRARHVVEHAFGILSNRFRVFLAPMNVRVEIVEKITFPCVALHNFLIENDFNYTTSYASEERSTDNTTAEGPYNSRKGEAENIRQQFMQYFNEEGKLNWQAAKT